MFDEKFVGVAESQVLDVSGERHAGKFPNSRANLFCGTGMILSISVREKPGLRNSCLFFISQTMRSKRMRSASACLLPFSSFWADGSPLSFPVSCWSVGVSAAPR